MKTSDTASPQRRGTDVHREEVIIVGWVGKDARRLAALLQTKERVLS